MKKLYWSLAMLNACQPQPAEQHAPSVTASTKAPVARPVAAAYTSGDRETTGPLDTLHVSRGVVLRLLPGSKKDFAQAPRMTAYATEAAYLKREDTAQVNRKKHTLYLTPATGKVLELTDDTSDMRGDQNEETDRSYMFLGSLKQLPYWQVDSSIYEGNTTLLVSKTNGSMSRLWNYPIVSPDKKHIIVQSQGIETVMAPNGLQLFDASTRRITLRWEHLLQHWEPYRVYWLNDNTLAIEQRRFPSTANGEEKFTYVRLLFPH